MSSMRLSALRLLSLALVSTPLVVAGIPAISNTLQNILKNTHGSDLYTYPTDLTRDIVPKPLHSHNDYWRDVPFYTGLSYGAVSTEADVWLINGTLYVGHEQSALTDARTFDALYVQPILDALKRQNPVSPYVTSPTRNGVFDTSSGQTFYFFVDLKTDGASTWPAVLSALEPLTNGNWCTTTDGKTITPGPVTVIGTGNTPLNFFLPNDPATASSPRFTFFDAQITSLSQAGYQNITSLISVTAASQFSAQFGPVAYDGMNETQITKLRSQIAIAKAKGIKARYWDTPGWPIRTRNLVWKTLVDEEVGLLNVDDVASGAAFWDGTS